MPLVYLDVVDLSEEGMTVVAVEEVYSLRPSPVVPVFVLEALRLPFAT